MTDSMTLWAVDLWDKDRFVRHGSGCKVLYRINAARLWLEARKQQMIRERGRRRRRHGKK